MDEQDIQDFFLAVVCAVILGICKPVPDHRRSQLPLQLLPVLFILLILYIDVK